MGDPRPDLVGDSPLWADLLARAYEVDGDDPQGLFAALDCVRCCGARLEWQDGGRLAFRKGEMERKVVFGASYDFEALKNGMLIPEEATWLTREQGYGRKRILTRLVREVAARIA